MGHHLPAIWPSNHAKRPRRRVYRLGGWKEDEGPSRGRVYQSMMKDELQFASRMTRVHQGVASPSLRPRSVTYRSAGPFATRGFAPQHHARTRRNFTCATTGLRADAARKFVRVRDRSAQGQVLPGWPREMATPLNRRMARTDNKRVIGASYGGGACDPPVHNALRGAGSAPSEQTACECLAYRGRTQHDVARNAPPREHKAQ